MTCLRIRGRGSSSLCQRFLKPQEIFICRNRLCLACMWGANSQLPDLVGARIWLQAGTRQQLCWPGGIFPHMQSKAGTYTCAVDTTIPKFWVLGGISSHPLYTTALLCCSSHPALCLQLQVHLHRSPPFRVLIRHCQVACSFRKEGLLWPFMSCSCKIAN